MKFIGISRKYYDPHNSPNYKKDTIGDFWDFVASFLPKESKLYGIELPWTYGADKPMEYAICVKPMMRFQLDKNFQKIKNKYPDAVLKEIHLPDIGWKVYYGQTKDLANLYTDKIFKECTPLHAIEEFNNDGTCKISIYPEKK